LQEAAGTPQSITRKPLPLRLAAIWIDRQAQTRQSAASQTDKRRQTEGHDESSSRSAGSALADCWRCWRLRIARDALEWALRISSSLRHPAQRKFHPMRPKHLAGHRRSRICRRQFL